MKEKLSAFIDAELSEIEERHLLGTLATDIALRGVWERYHLARAAIRRQLDVTAPSGLVNKVAQQLAETTFEPNPRRGIYYYKFAGGVAAAAAALAAIAVFGLQIFQLPIQDPERVATSSLPSVPATVESMPVAAEGSGMNLNAYLVGHNEFMPTAGMGMLPYARVVSFDDDRR